MKNLIGKKWMELSETEKAELLKTPSAIDGSTGNRCINGDCIIDLTELLSIDGKVVDGVIIIDDEAVIYSPAYWDAVDEIIANEEDDDYLYQ